MTNYLVMQTGLGTGRRGVGEGGTRVLVIGVKSQAWCYTTAEIFMFHSRCGL